MRSLTKCFVLLAVSFVAPGSLVYAQGDQPADERAKSAPTGATKEEVEQLRREVAELKAIIQRLVQVNQQGAGTARLVQTSAPQPANTATSPETAQADKKPAEKKPADAGLSAGWNGEHFFIKSTDGKFQIQPNGYFQTDFRVYGSGDGAPPNTFVIRRARFGFLGNYGTKIDYSVLLDTAPTSGAVLRDLFIQVKPRPEFQFMVGQFKEPFAQELLEAVTNIDFVERGLTSLLYPSAATAFRSPGAMLHGDISGGAFQYWVGAFNGKGIATANTTSEPEVIGRVRFTPWKTKKGAFFQGLAFGGGIGHGRSRGLSGETSFGGALPDAAFTFFPTFRINGPIERYNGEFTFTHGPWALRGEYDQLNQFRRNVGTEVSGGSGFESLPGVIAKAGYLQATYLLTGEARPENAPPKVKHPWLGPETPGGGGLGWGAWEVKFRYDKIQARAGGAVFPSAVAPQAAPTFEDHADRFTTGVNWYPNYWVRYMLDFSVDRAKDPTVGGATPQNYFVVLQRLQFRF